MAKIRLRTSTPTEVRRALSRIANMVINGELEPKVANSAILACNAILSYEKLKESEARTKNIEVKTVLLQDDSELEDLSETDDLVYNGPEPEDKPILGYPYNEHKTESRTDNEQDVNENLSEGEPCGQLIRPNPRLRSDV